MKPHSMARILALSLALVAANSALAQVSFSIILAPPDPVYEMVPIMPPGYVWAPGYWAWNHDRHIWMRGRSMVQRAGYRWEPDRWEQRDGNYSRQVGRWERDTAMRPVKMQKARQDNGHGQHGKSGKRHGGERGEGR